MARFALNPHPFGCPLGIARNPDEMPEFVAEICVRLMDVLGFSVHVIEPSKGQRYPLLNMVRDGESGPRMVIFPAWEDNKRRRRLDFKRQFALLKRISDNDVNPERIEDFTAKHATTLLDDPMLVPVARTAAQMPSFITDLDAALGDLFRITVQTLDASSPIPTRVVRLYAPTEESMPRVFFFPGWRAAAERARDRMVEEDCLSLLERLEVEQTKEVSVEVFLAG